MPLSSGPIDASLALTQAVEKISLAADLESLTRVVAEAARQLAQADGTTFVLRDQDQCYYVDENAISPLWKGQRFPLEICVSGWSMLHKEVAIIPDIYQDARVPRAAYQPTFVKSLCMVPIRSANPIGAIGNYWRESYTPTPAQVKLLQVLANSTAVALENLELKNRIQRSHGESADLRDKTKELEAALHSLAHDLRNPVSAMAGLAELVRQELPPETDPILFSYLDSIFDTARQTNQQIERMLALYRTTGREMKKETVNLSDVSRRILGDLQMQLPNRRVQAEISEGLIVHGDAALLHLAVENLLSNALKYSSKKPHSEIRVGKLDSPTGFQTFFIGDNGEGFEASQAHKLFRPMARLHSDKDFPGTGLGLFSVARIIELPGGRMRAEGRPREGATFFFSLPALAIS